ncbi:hypothetical protein ACFO5K_20560 [Nocardia halotolerans]|uniref:Uncharacterized protein n=1 Tax=Nocardia halotolerans TaxID=1755878 RepID=A0ABV8VLG8_9NOCA
MVTAQAAVSGIRDEHYGEQITAGFVAELPPGPTHPVFGRVPRRGFGGVR